MDKKKIIIKDLIGNIAFNGKITSLSLKEELIIKKSIEFFNDDSPCFIHRSAVMKRLFVELEEFLECGAKQGRNQWGRNDLPENIKAILSGVSDAEFMLYYDGHY